MTDYFDYSAKGYGKNYEAMAKEKAKKELGGKDKISIENFKKSDSVFSDIIADNEFIAGLDGDKKNISADELAAVMVYADDIKGGKKDGKISTEASYTTDFDKLEKRLKNFDSGSDLDKTEKNKVKDIYTKVKEDEGVSPLEQGQNNAKEESPNLIIDGEKTKQIKNASDNYMNGLQGYSNKVEDDTYSKDDLKNIDKLFKDEKLSDEEKKMILYMYRDMDENGKVNGEIETLQDEFMSINLDQLANEDHSEKEGDERKNLEQNMKDLTAIKDKVVKHTGKANESDEVDQNDDVNKSEEDELILVENKDDENNKETVKTNEEILNELTKNLDKMTPNQKAIAMVTVFLMAMFGANGGNALNSSLQKVSNS